MILVQFGLITFRFAHGRIRKPSFLWFRDFWTSPWAPKPTILSLETSGHLSTINEKQIISTNTTLIISSFGEHVFENLRKEWLRKSRRSVWQFLENLGYGINIFQKTWNGNLVNLWNQETMKPKTKKPINFSSKGIPSTPHTILLKLHDFLHNLKHLVHARRSSD